MSLKCKLVQNYAFIPGAPDKINPGLHEDSKFLRIHGYANMEGKKNILMIGGGGREHALIWKLAQSERVKKIVALPGSYGISLTPKTISLPNIAVNNFEGIHVACKEHSIDFVVVGLEETIVAGITDFLEERGFKCFAPNKIASQIEGDKDWSKAFMNRHGIPTARYQSFTNPDLAKAYINNAPFPALVVKACGVAAGKGVIVAKNKQEACEAVDIILVQQKFGKAGDTIVVEELLEGEEVSVLAFTDGKVIRSMLPAQDHKRIGDGDTGPNTGGMGAYCPCPLISNEDLKFVQENVLQATVDGLRKEGIKYVGVLYAGVMLTPSGPMILEFNCRFGDPETEVLMPMLETDLCDIMMHCLNGTLAQIEPKWKTNVSSVGVVMASGGYPDTSTKGSVISGLKLVSNLPDHIVFHCGTASSSNGALVSNGGRVLIVIVMAPTLRAAASLSTSACKQISFPGAQFRKDIAHKALTKVGNLSYLDSGVDMEAEAALFRVIEPVARSSHRPGVLGRLGCFGGLYELARQFYIDRHGNKVLYKDPVLVEGADGVGTKLEIAGLLNKYNTIGIDLVAMNVNDILCAGAEPFAFLDYIACGKLEVDVAAQIVEGIAKACRETGCALLGGETAEMPAMYDSKKYDLAGFAVGIVENELQLPRINEIVPGDVVIALPSTGVHSNGYSLVQKIFSKTGLSYHDIAEFSETGKTYGEEFLTPTGLYVKPLLSAIRSGYVKALANITGGGLTENIPRILPKNVKVKLNAENFSIPPVFSWLSAAGAVDDFEMLRTFNCGVGMVGIVSPENVEKVRNLITDCPSYVIGTVEPFTSNDGQQVVVDNFKSTIESKSARFKNRKIALARGLSYKDSGVDIEAGDSLVNFIKPIAKSTLIDGVIGGLGGFGGLFRMNGINKRYKEPVLVMSTNGVGTKLKIAQDTNQHHTIGIDLVAMCVNDILCNGAEPLTFLDYYACSNLDVNVAKEVITGVGKGCRQANCALLGGETAEMPGMYKKDIYDIAGFALGVVEKSQILPKLNEINIGDSIIGLPSNGVHSNGFSLIHKLMAKLNCTMNDIAPFSEDGLTFGEELLQPAKIYASCVLPAIHKNKVKAIANIKSGGLIENIPKIIPENMKARLNAYYWHVQPVFAWIADTGNVTDEEMIKTFNCGIGMVLIVSPEDQAEVMNITRSSGAMVIGSIQAFSGTGPRVMVDHFSSALEYIRRLSFLPVKRVAVLISGNGSNLQALIDSTRNGNQGICAEIALVISNKKTAYGLKRAELAGIPYKVIPHSSYSSREDFEKAISDTLEEAKIDIVCLAGFMRILTSTFTSKWKGKLLNIHPSLLPKFKGMDAQKQALEAGEEETGCSVHFVDDGVDTGPIILQERVNILKDDTLDTLRERIHQAEHRAYPRALRLLAGGRVRLGPDNRLLHVY